MFDFEKTPKVCEKCGGSDWHSNQVFYNRQKCWMPDTVEFWCGDCEMEVDVMSVEEYEEEKNESV